MADIGFGLTRENIMEIVYKIVEEDHHKHFFHDDMAGRGWFEGFRASHPNFTIWTPQLPLYCHALYSSKSITDNFLSKIGKSV